MTEPLYCPHGAAGKEYCAMADASAAECARRPSSPEPTERITHVAIMRTNGPGCYSLPLPLSHYALSERIKEIAPYERPLKQEQGFIATSPDGVTRFVDRAEARQIAVKNGQVRDDATYNSEHLFSEDFLPKSPASSPMNEPPDHGGIVSWEEYSALRERLAQAEKRAAALYADSMIAHRWFAKCYGEEMNGRDFAAKCEIADDRLHAAQEKLAAAITDRNAMESHYMRAVEERDDEHLARANAERELQTATEKLAAQEKERESWLRASEPDMPLEIDNHCLDSDCVRDAPHDGPCLVAATANVRLRRELQTATEKLAAMEKGLAETRTLDYEVVLTQRAQLAAAQERIRELDAALKHRPSGRTNKPEGIRGTRCETCGLYYHICGSCDVWEDEAWIHEFCSESCWRVATLTAERDALEQENARRLGYLAGPSEEKEIPQT